MEQEEEENKGEKSPILGNWNNVYILVLSILLLQIILYYILTIYFS